MNDRAQLDGPGLYISGLFSMGVVLLGMSGLTLLTGNEIVAGGFFGMALAALFVSQHLDSRLRAYSEDQ